ncbi:Syntenin-1 [Trichoplax sp. H2]|uniref:PDZ domain-containing protein n=1 Tax=Trichoplax adhaerens TaxID=10228 RepID=B3S229_TRIAD|nr:expressed hypothetical protein [Trichoplax adhaerens]EDV23361.1 expressed hypothetical protein [Trichoplax adhaerens]RDD46201.1 Syntenin-1 [Trichoplax sp. H2]|eukprot:XP_002114271.1 expressed hypothetical protein [Trichoplax adhaerens]
MSSLYPSLEDMKVDQMIQAQAAVNAAQQAPAPPALPAGQAPIPGSIPTNRTPSLYPSLQEYMGLDLTNVPPEVQQQMLPTNVNNQVAVPANTNRQVVAPVSGDAVGIRRAEVKQGIRMVILAKDNKNKLGLRVRNVNNGIFVQFVSANSAAAMGGLRFGDQILQINGQNLAGLSTDKAMKFFKNATSDRIELAVRDRPFERTITLQKNSDGNIGFVFKNGKVTHIVKDSSAARNGILTEHNLVEVDGQNVVGMKDKDIGKIFQACGRTVTVTIIPTFIFDHIMKHMASSLVKKQMDHSIPEI